MKTNRAHHLAALLLLPLLFLVVGCDTVDPTTAPPPQPQFRIDCFVPDGATEMVFEATGGIEDKGSLSGYPLHVDWRQEAATTSRILHRNLEGDKGFLALQVEARPARYGSVLAEGTFTIIGGSKAYAHLQGQGEFYVTLNGLGEEVEIFTGLLN